VPPFSPAAPLAGLPCWPVPLPLPVLATPPDFEDALFPPEPETELLPPAFDGAVAPPPEAEDFLAGDSALLPPLGPPPEFPTAVGGESVYSGMLEA
jgi:hypothetical protein